MSGPVASTAAMKGPSITTAAGTPDAFDTIPKLLLRNARQYADKAAIRRKDLGIWQSWTWSQVHDEVKALAIGLRKLGLERGDSVAIIGSNQIGRAHV